MNHHEDDAVEALLRSWIAELCVNPPLVDELTVNDLATPCGRASLLRAALRQRLDKSSAVIRADLDRDLAEADFYVRHRLREASHDVRGRTRWVRLYDVVRARREAREAA